jgi:hypothetical protein
MDSESTSKVQKYIRGDPLLAIQFHFVPPLSTFTIFFHHYTYNIQAHSAPCLSTLIVYVYRYTTSRSKDRLSANMASHQSLVHNLDSYIKASGKTDITIKLTDGTIKMHKTNLEKHSPALAQQVKDSKD